MPVPSEKDLGVTSPDTLSKNGKNSNTRSSSSSSSSNGTNSINNNSNSNSIGLQLPQEWLLGSRNFIVMQASSLLPLRVQVPNNRILTQNLYYNYYYPKPKYLIVGYLDPLGTYVTGRHGISFQSGRIPSSGSPNKPSGCRV